ESPNESDNETDNKDENKIMKESNNTDYEDAQPKDFISNNSKEMVNNPIQKLFICIFVNNSWTCASPIENPYYFAKFISIFAIAVIVLILV
ncbi:3162_t:CDS:2, partial [Gigaspora margarita]